MLKPKSKLLSQNLITEARIQMLKPKSNNCGRGRDERLFGIFDECSFDKAVLIGTDIVIFGPSRRVDGTLNS